MLLEIFHHLLEKSLILIFPIFRDYEKTRLSGIHFMLLLFSNCTYDKIICEYLKS